MRTASARSASSSAGIGSPRVCCVMATVERRASAFVIEALPALLAEYSNGDASGPGLCSAAERAFRLLHAKLNHASAATTAGTTVTLCLINETRGELTCCSVGDSFAVLVTASPDESGDLRKQDKQAPLITELTVNPRLDDCASERQRVRSEGGQIGRAMGSDGTPVGPLRAWPGGVSCASALGDSDCGKFISPTPFTITLPFPESGGAVILASDGVWDAVNFTSAAKLALNASTATAAAEAVVSKSMRARGLRDDITCLVAVSAALPPTFDDFRHQQPFPLCVPSTDEGGGEIERPPISHAQARRVPQGSARGRLGEGREPVCRLCQGLAREQQP